MKIYAEKVGEGDWTGISPYLLLNINKVDFDILRNEPLKTIPLKITPLGSDQVDIYEPTARQVAVYVPDLQTEQPQLGSLDISHAMETISELDSAEDYVLEFEPYDPTASLRQEKEGQSENMVEAFGDQPVPEDDPDSYGVLLAIQAMFREEHDWEPPEELAWRAAKKLKWSGRQFSAKPLDSNGEVRFNVVYGTDDYFTALHFMFGEENHMADSIIAYHQDYREQNSNAYLVCIMAASRFTPTEVTYFQEWLKKGYGKHFLRMDIPELTEAIVTFQGSSLQYLGDYFRIPVLPSFGIWNEKTSLLADYAREGDPDKEAELRELIPRINALDPSVIQLYTGPELLDTFNRDRLRQLLANSGLTAEELDRYDDLIKYQLVSRAFEMLEHNEKLLREEKTKLEDEENLNAVVDIIKGEEANLFEAKRLQYAGLKLWRTYMPREKIEWLSEQLNKEGRSLTSALGNFEKRYGVEQNTMYQMAYLDRWAKYRDSVDFKQLQYIRSFLTDVTWLYASMLVFRRGGDFHDPFDRELYEIFISGEGHVPPSYREDRSLIEDFLNTYCPQLLHSERLNAESEKRLVDQAEYMRSDGTQVEFRILKDLTFNYPNIARLERIALKAKLLNGIDEKIQNIYTVISYLNSDPDFIWQMGAVIDYEKMALGIFPDTPADAIIMDHVSDEASSLAWTSLGVGALSLLLALGGAFTGGASTTLGVALITGSAAVGLADVVIEYHRFQFGRAVSNTALREADELGSVHFSALGVVMALVGLGIDTFQVVTAVNQLMKVNKLVKGAKVNAALLYDELAVDGKVISRTGKEVSKEEFVKTVEKATRKHGAAMSKSKVFQDLINAKDLPPAARPGLFKLLSENPDAFTILTKLNKVDPKALANIGMQLTLEGRLTGVTAEILTFLEKDLDSLTKIFNSFGGVHSAAFGNLPDFWHIIKNSDAYDHPELVAIMLEDVRFQYKLFDNPGDIDLITYRYNNYVKAGGYAQKGSFTGFLGRGRSAYRIETGTRKTIAEYFADSPELLALFSKPGNHRAKNLALLSTTEPELASRLAKGELLPGNKKLQKALSKVLDQDWIGTTTDIANARSKVVAPLHEAVGKNIDIHEFRAMDAAGLPMQQGGRGSWFEHWIIANHEQLWEGGAQLQSKLTISGDELRKTVTFRDFEGTRIILDNYYLEGELKIGLEFKHVAGKLTGKPREQMEIYKGLIDEGFIDEIEYVFSSKAAAQANYWVIINTFEDGQYVKISYINDLGKKITF